MKQEEDVIGEVTMKGDGKGIGRTTMEKEQSKRRRKEKWWPTSKYFVSEAMLLTKCGGVSALLPATLFSFT